MSCVRAAIVLHTGHDHVMFEQDAEVQHRGRFDAAPLFCVVALFSMALTCTSIPNRALAHILPYSTTMLRDPLDGQHQVIKLSRGFLLSADGGGSWNLMCAASVGQTATLLEPAPIVAGPDGWITGSTKGLWTAGWDGCGAKRSAGPLQDRFVTDLSAEQGVDPSSRRLFGTVAGTLPAADAGSVMLDADVFVSEDGGKTWQPMVAPLAGASPNRVRVATSDTTRVYVTAVFPEQDAVAYYLVRSIDGGATWSKLRLGDTGADILDIDRTNPDRVLIAVTTTTGAVQVQLSEDAGASLSLLTEVPSIGGATFSDDGKSVWIASSQGELYRVDGTGPAKLAQGHAVFRCLSVQDGRLLACGENWLDDFVIGVSDDSGESFQPLVRLQDAQSPVSCSDPDLATTCDFEWKEWQREVITRANSIANAKDAGPPGAGMRDAATTDAGATDAGTKPTTAPDASATPTHAKDSGCSCAAVGAPRNGPGIGWMLISVLGLARAARRSAIRVGMGCCGP
jgi:hypothetical protein